MSDKRLGIAQRATLFILMAAARPLTNKEIKAVGGFTPLTGKQLDPIRRYVHTNPLATGHIHSLTDDGWAWCEKELTAGMAGREGSAGGALYAVLGGLAGYLSRHNLRLADIFEASAEEEAIEEPVEDAEAAIRAAYRQLRDEPRGFVSLTSLRPMLAGLSKQEVDDTLRRMNNTKGVNVIPQSNQKILTAQDRAAMIRVGNEDRLLISIDEP